MANSKKSQAIGGDLIGIEGYGMGVHENDEREEEAGCH